MPLHAQHGARHGDAALAGVDGREELVLRLHAAGAGRHLHVEGEHVDGIALPFQGLAVGGQAQAGQLVQRAAGAVVAGHPLRIQQGQFAGRGGDAFADAEQLLRHVAGIDVQHDGSRAGRGGLGRSGNEQ